jgi:hypothetical protein
MGRILCVAFGAVMAFCTGAQARPPRPQLNPAAVPLLANGALLLPEDDLVVPLAGGKALPFLVPPPRRLELLAIKPGEALIVIDDDVYRYKAGALQRVASQVGAQPAASDDASLVASIEDKRALRLTRGEVSRRVPYQRSGHFELERPWLTADGKRALVAVHDYGATLDVYEFIVLDTNTNEFHEIKLSNTFVPGPLRQPLSPTEVAIQMFAQHTDDHGMVGLSETDVVVFNLDTRKIVPAPKDLKPGLASPSARFSLLAGGMAYSDDKRCGGDHTLLFEAGRPKPASFQTAADVVVSVLDFLPDESGIIANVLSLKSCKNRGVVIPLKKGGGEVTPAEWKPFALPVRLGRLTGRVIPPAR